jgi:hypothetical protein
MLFAYAEPSSWLRSLKVTFARGAFSTPRIHAPAPT